MEELKEKYVLVKGELADAEAAKRRCYGVWADGSRIRVCWRFMGR